MVVLDASFLLLFLYPDAAAPATEGNKPIDHGAERVEHLIQQLQQQKSKIVIPSPALAEVLVRPTGDAAHQIVERLQRAQSFRIQAFDTRAAIELAEIDRSESTPGNKRGASGGTWAKVKFDRQIVAIAKVVRATALYSADGGLRKLAKRQGLTAIGLGDLFLPPATAQRELKL